LVITGTLPTVCYAEGMDPVSPRQRVADLKPGVSDAPLHGFGA